MYATEDRSPMDPRKPIDLPQEVKLRQDEAERSSPEELLRWAADRFGSRLAVSSSFGVEAVVLIDIAARAIKNLQVFTLDTDFLFTETHQLIDTVQNKYGIRVERVRPLLSPEAQAAQFGAALWERDPNLCCRIRKIDPLKAKAAELDAWVTGIRREQTSARASAKKLEWDGHFGLVKINPLLDWTFAQAWEYLRLHDLPYNTLQDRGYQSVGCTHCTRPVQRGEDPRAGRWAGFPKSECGLHAKE